MSHGSLSGQARLSLTGDRRRCLCCLSCAAPVVWYVGSLLLSQTQGALGDRGTREGRTPSSSGPPPGHPQKHPGHNPGATPLGHLVRAVATPTEAGLGGHMLPIPPSIRAPPSRLPPESTAFCPATGGLGSMAERLPLTEGLRGGWVEPPLLRALPWPRATLASTTALTPSGFPTWPLGKGSRAPVHMREVGARDGVGWEKPRVPAR